MAYVDHLTNGPYIKAEDPKSLEGFSILLSSCTNTLKAFGYLNKIEGPDNMRKIIERLPPKLQSSWRDNADGILNVDKREVCIEYIASFVEEKSCALSNPIFGKLPFLAKDKKKSQMRGAKSKPEGSGPVPGPRELSYFSTSSQKSPMNQNKSQEKKSEDVSKRSCLFCRQIHNLVDCPAFAKIPVRECFDFVMKQRLCFSCLRGSSIKGMLQEEAVFTL